MSFRIKLRHKPDNIIPAIGLLLSLVGLIMILSASQFYAAENLGNPYYFFLKQLGAWVVGLVAFFFFMHYPIDQLYEKRWTLFWITIVLLVSVFLPIISHTVGGVRRWVYLGPLSFQPAEFAKLTFLLFLAAWLAAKGDKVASFTQGWIPFLALIVLIGILLSLEKDMGTTVVIIGFSLVLFFVGRADVFQLVALLVVVGAALLLIINFTPYQAKRLGAFLNQSDQTAEETYHNRQALIAIGSGGWWGAGFGQGLSKHAYLPEAHTDSIFAVIAEELGFVRSLVLLGAYLVLLWRGFLIAWRANSRFVQLLAVGIVFYFFSQALINVSGMLGVIPLTGVPLPLVGAGGSSLIASLAFLGILTNISREVE